MKKIVVTLLLVLPFFLIFSVSVTGKILSKYSHVYVEEVQLLNADGDPFARDTVVQIGKGETYQLNIKILPELASNPDVTIQSENENFCTVDSKTGIVTGVAYGTAKITVTSKDNSEISASLYVKVSDDDVSQILPSKTELSLTLGKSEKIAVTLLPTTALPENRTLRWISADPSIATVSAGIIRGVGEGTTTIRVETAHNPNVYAEITVHVSTEIRKEVYFDVPIGKIWSATDSTIDLFALTKFTISDYDTVSYEVVSNTAATDISRLNEHILVITTANTPIKVTVTVTAGENTYTDELVLRLVQP